MFSCDDENLMKPLISFDWFFSDTSRCGLQLNPDAFSREQFWSKLWCVQTIKKQLGTEFDEIYILGGWYGTLAAMLLQDPEIKITKVINLDLDQEALDHSKVLIKDPRYEARQADFNDFLAHSYRLQKKTLVICSICEHINGLDSFNRLKPGLPIVFQSTNLKCQDHINTKESIEDFKKDFEQIKNFNLQWSGTLDLKFFKRFMVIGQIKPQTQNCLINFFKGQSKNRHFASGRT